jgi:hypothetical protein
VLAIGARSEVKETALRKVFHDLAAHYLRDLANLDAPSRSRIVDCDSIRCVDGSWRAAGKHHEKREPHEAENVHGWSRSSRACVLRPAWNLWGNEKY